MDDDVVGDDLVGVDEALVGVLEVVAELPANPVGAGSAEKPVWITAPVDDVVSGAAREELDSGAFRFGRRRPLEAPGAPAEERPFADRWVDG